MDVANLEIVTILRVPFWRLIIIVVIFIKETIVVVVPPSSCALRVSVNLLWSTISEAQICLFLVFGFLYKC
jgi:hypothetical protein